MKAQEIQALISEYGPDFTLQEIFNNMRRPYKCPKCEGVGYTLEKYDAYPQGLPDSGWATDIKTRKVDCKVCDGHGWTARELKPITETKIIGYREV